MHYVALTPPNGKYSEAAKHAREQFEIAFLSVKPVTRDRAKQHIGSHATRPASPVTLARDRLHRSGKL